MAIEVRVIGLERLQRNLSGAPGVLNDETRKAMTTGLLLLEAEQRRLAPRDTGQLAGSIHHTITGSGAALTGRVGPQAKHGIYVEKGTRPHFPPIDAVRGWARRKGINPFLVARAIARRGTRAQPFVAPSLDKHANTITGLFSKIGVRIVQHIVGGG